MKKLKPGQKILLALAFLGDLFEDLADAGGLMSFSYQQIYGFVPQKYKKHNFQATVSRSLKVGNIEKTIKKDQVCLRLSSLGREKIFNDIPLLTLRKKPWGGKWLMVIFDIPEKNSSARKALREKLKELGFGMLQRSVWISPHDFSSLFQEFLENIGFANEALVIGPTQIGIADEKALVEKVFRLKEINSFYQKLIEKWKNEKNKKNKNFIREIKSQYLEILTTDPFLPDELLPKDWWGEKAEKLIKTLVKVKNK
ncbi:CRISPR-associated endonuclease Cas2 [Candidatus Microgenomates bacterium]|nr:CRISPR-associated endonuclease Cas2 [Candidatus Microgenomates bacterium]